ncbi:MAG: InlB B-repeat-containing protein, partial [Oscillospiraceae bacterium]|nr:InlB B-repeat-containing protein [Oscillospiraceae bacterium]
TITWLDDEGNEIDTTSVAYGTVPTHANAQKEDTNQFTYTFTGWDPTPAAVSGEASYSAVFDQAPREYTITWLDDEGNEIDTTSVAYGTVPTHEGVQKEPTEQYSYTFVAWDPTPAAVSGEASYSAVFDQAPREYTITWLDDEGNEIDTTSVAYGTVPTHANAQKEDTEQYSYTFTGWDPTPSAVSGEASYSAVFDQAPREYTITWLDDEGNEIDTTSVAYGTIPTHEDAQKEDTNQFTYTFVAWDPTPIAVTGEASYTATYSSTEKYTVTFIMNEHGDPIEEQHVVSGGFAAEPAVPTDDEYEFVGWYADEELTDPFLFDSSPITDDTMIYARWRVLLVGHQIHVVIPDSSGIVISISDGANDEDVTSSRDIEIPVGTVIQVSFDQSSAEYIAGPDTTLTAGTETLAQGAHIDGVTYTYTVEADATITLSNLYQIVTEITDSSAGYIAVTDSVNVSSSTHAVDEIDEVTLDAHLYITSTGSLTIPEGYKLTLAAGKTIYNDGSILVEVAEVAELINNGTITNADGGTITVAQRLTNNSEGIINNNAGGSITIPGYLVNFGTINNADGATILIPEYGELANNADGSVSNSGAITINADGYLTNSGTIVNNTSGIITNDGTFIDNGTFTNNGTLIGNDPES